MIVLVGALLPGLRQQGAGLVENHSGGMVLVNLLERLDDPGMSNEAAAEALLRAVLRPPAAPTRPARRRFAAVPGGLR
jgi:hypothetical protein